MINTYKNYIKYKWLVLIICFIAVIVCSIFSLFAGSTDLSLKDIILSVTFNADKQINTIIWNIRMPRILASIAVGIALAMSGCIMQNVLHNPLASASTMGVSQGASFGAAFAIICLGAGMQINSGGTSAALSITNPYIVTICAFLGGLATTIIILILSRFFDATPSVMVLVGVAISSMFTGGTTLIQYFADDVMVATVVYWTFGSLSRAGTSEISIIFILCIISFIFFIIHSWHYNAIESGLDTAKSLGISTDFLIPFSMAVCTLLASVSVAFVGCISFIGLIAPHIMRYFVGNDYRFLIPSSAMCGAVLMLLSDIACRVLVKPVVLPIGALTSFLGAPIFLYLIMKRGFKP